MNSSLKTLLIATSALTAFSMASPVIAEHGEKHYSVGEAKPNQFWFPKQLNLRVLRHNETQSDPRGADYDYGEALQSLDYEALKADMIEVLTNSQDWWPADYGHYGPLFVRLSWHAAGTYRTYDGRGGAGGGDQRFDPLGSWRDNGNLDKARRLLWPVKKKYGKTVSWADLIVLAGTIGMEDMGFKTYGFAFGRKDVFEAEPVYWGPEIDPAGADRGTGDGIERSLGASEMSLIYVNPEGPGGNNDPLSAASDIRTTFERMAMDDGEIVALIAGGHAFGKAHGATKGDCVGAAPGGAPVEQQGLGWKNSCGSGKAEYTTTSGLEGAWTATPAQWTTMYLDNLFAYEWEQQESPSGGIVWVPTDDDTKFVPDAHVDRKFHKPIMLTTDLTLREDPGFRKISKRFQENPEEFEAAYARAWFKLTHRDMGPRARFYGPDIPEEVLLWEDPIPEPVKDPINDRDARRLKKAVMESGLSTQELVRAAWASASSFRVTDYRGGANGARLRLAPQKDWEVNRPSELERVLGVLGDIRYEFNEDSRRRKVSMADLIVLAGAAAIEDAASKAGYDIEVPFAPGRTDASQDQTDVASFNVLEPHGDAFRNYIGKDFGRTPSQLMVDKADLLDLDVAEMTVLLGGMRALGANYDGSKHGVFTDREGVLSNDFFVNLLDMTYAWQKTGDNAYEVVDRATGKTKWTATEVDLIFGANAELRAVAEYYATDDAMETFVNDFVAAWSKVMRSDRFDLTRAS